MAQQKSYVFGAQVKNWIKKVSSRGVGILFNWIWIKMGLCLEAELYLDFFLTFS